MTYMAKVSSATSETNPSGLNWFKIAQTGLSGTTWAVDTLRSAGGKWSVKVPSSIAAGDYLIRQEILALHSAYNSGGAQFYIGCAQIKVTGGGSASPATVKLPGAYSASNAGILVNIYNGEGKPYPSSYSIPGPAVFSG
jgi:cellulase